MVVRLKDSKKERKKKKIEVGAGQRGSERLCTQHHSKAPLLTLHSRLMAAETGSGEDELPRPTTAYRHFVDAKQKEYEMDPNVDVKKIRSVMLRAWQALDKETKAPFIRRCQEERAKYRAATKHKKEWTKKTISRWTCEEVSGFVEAFGKGACWAKYATLLDGEEIDGVTLTCVELSDFIEMGFTRVHSRLLLKAARKVKILCAITNK
jgi:hypothetical protein